MGYANPCYQTNPLGFSLLCLSFLTDHPIYCFLKRREKLTCSFLDPYLTDTTLATTIPCTYLRHGARSVGIRTNAVPQTTAGVGQTSLGGSFASR